MADFSFSDDLELKRLNEAVLLDLDNYELWELLIGAAEKQEGGLTRNSSPSAIEATRNVYDRFLAHFPLFFGYWKKYADLEFAIAGTEAADLVYERGVASIPNSVDLWTNYLNFKVETTHDYDVTRELFERGAEAVGLDFMSYPFWDAYLEFEERADSPARKFQILKHLINVPSHQYYRYWTRFIELAAKRPFEEHANSDVMNALLREVSQAEQESLVDKESADRLLGQRLSQLHSDKHQATQTAVNARWPFESEIKRPYFHVLALDEAELANWRKYLDYEETQGDYQRIKFLYERCLVTTARYEEFWFRYARWMQAQEDKTEEVRNIYRRASCLFVPRDLPAIRLHYAKYEESTGCPSIAVDIHEAILANLPNHADTIISLAGLNVRQYGIEAGIDVLRRYVDNAETDPSILGELICAWADLIWASSGDYQSTREVWVSHMGQCHSSFAFWRGWFSFEANFQSKPNETGLRHHVVKKLYEQVRAHGPYSADELEEITARYLHFLQYRGGQESMKEFLQIDRDINGPSSVRAIATSRSANGL